MMDSPDSPGNSDSKKNAKRQPLRSSIACQRCRKSKIKCNNTGGDSPCETCIRNGKECTYPEATPLPVKRPEPPSSVKSDAAADRKRLRKIDDISKIDSAIPAAVFAEEVLSAPYLSEGIWSQIFEIYRMHFETELPFLHLATLKEKVGYRFRSKNPEPSHEVNLVLLGVLTLTARFHSTLVSYVTTPRTAPGAASLPRSRPAGSTDAAAASEYYAEVLTKAIGGLRTSMTVASVERVQAFLMLGLYEWSQARPKVGGMAAWMYVGVAIRMAQALGLCEGDRERERSFKSLAVLTPKAFRGMTPTQQLVAREVRRRTMFSCLVLDRLLGCGHGRVSTIRSEDLNIKLPVAENLFNMSMDVYTGFLKPLPDDPLVRPGEDSLLGHFVRLVDLWGEISKWSFAGGRFTENVAPWKPESGFYQLRQKLQHFYDTLPSRFQWSYGNFYAHENQHFTSSFISFHMLSSVCRIMLHREYIPFIPIRCRKPMGPLDEPTFAAGAEPPGFWDESAEEVFAAAKDVVDLIDLARDKLPMSALILFAVWTAAFVGVYAICFPHMDTKRHMLPSVQEAARQPDLTKSNATNVTYKTLKQMSSCLRMAETYVGYFREMVNYYEMVKQDYEKQMTGKHPGNGEGGKLSVRLGGGGLEEWKQQGPKIVNNGAILAVEDDRGSPSGDSPESSASPDNTYHSEHAKTPGSMSFTPINSSHQQQQDYEEHGNSQWRHQQGHSQAQQQQQSPSQSSYAMPSPQMTQAQAQAQAQAAASGTGVAATVVAAIPNIPVYGSTHEVMEFLTANQSMPWSLAPGGIDQFAHGSEDLFPIEVYWDNLPETGVVQYS